MRKVLVVLGVVLGYFGVIAAGVWILRAPGSEQKECEVNVVADLHVFDDKEERKPVCDLCWGGSKRAEIEGDLWWIIRDRGVDFDEAVQRCRDERLDMRNAMQELAVQEIQQVLNRSEGKVVPREQVEALKYRFED